MVIVDISEHRLGVAKEMGAHHTVHVDSRDARAMAKKVEDALSAMPDITIECSGAEASIQTGIYVSSKMLQYFRQLHKSQTSLEQPPSRKANVVLRHFVHCINVPVTNLLYTV